MRTDLVRAVQDGSFNDVKFPKGEKQKTFSIFKVKVFQLMKMLKTLENELCDFRFKMIQQKRVFCGGLRKKFFFQMGKLK